MRELQPLNDNVLLDLNEDKKEQKTASGIIIPDTAKEKPQYAKVIAVGNVENPGIKAGDVVFYKRFAGNEVEFEGNKYLFIPYADILAKVVETEEI
ncbi:MULTISPECIES: co-chaperone GroES [unclassified Lentimicrobium]|uniref:co-chaperone GroES n=1 Tax=unclassified Lentimicrobium TaxID=2677434 RepID=UPI0015531DAC|nr:MULTISPECIES: co-chaperone GroES [unclassified Lentimicrobium]NPD47195.1 co-chaperone GroES [Lentimicrobium sp. S6]NPD84882.1 co-chaperone GroES [Lentimicrobium sp. L6]